MAFDKDKRSEERLPAGPNSACVFASPVLEDFGPVKLHNISLRGVGLLMSHPLDQGMLLAIKLANNVQNFSKTVLFRVAHATPQPGGVYLVGGDFDTPLSYEEFRNLVM
jgi:hypothetical protein